MSEAPLCWLIRDFCCMRTSPRRMTCISRFCFFARWGSGVRLSYRNLRYFPAGWMLEIRKLSRMRSSSSPKKLELELEEPASLCLASWREGETLVGLCFFITIILDDSNLRTFIDS